MTGAAEIEDRAAAWLLRREEPGWSDDEQAALDAWLDASSLHRVTFYRLEYGWRKADRLAALKAPAPAAPDRRFSPRDSWRPLSFAALLIATIAGGAMFFLNGTQVSTRTYATELGGRASFPLDDGSRVELDTDTQLRTGLGTHSRAAWLDHGEAYFEVSHDADRPFVIHAGTGLVTVIGTKFSVRRDTDTVRVAVLEGRVQVDAKPALSAIATPGDIVVIQGGALRVERATVDSIANALGWRQGHLTFDQATLADAAREFNRYNRKKLVVSVMAATAIHVGGTFDAENVDAFTRLLQQAYGLKVDDNGTRVVISGSKRSH